MAKNKKTSHRCSLLTMSVPRESSSFEAMEREETTERVSIPVFEPEIQKPKGDAPNLISTQMASSIFGVDVLHEQPVRTRLDKFVLLSALVMSYVDLGLDINVLFVYSQSTSIVSLLGAILVFSQCLLLFITFVADDNSDRDGSTDTCCRPRRLNSSDDSEITTGKTRCCTCHEFVSYLFRPGIHYNKKSFARQTWFLVFMPILFPFLLVFSALAGPTVHVVSSFQLGYESVAVTTILVGEALVESGPQSFFQLYMILSRWGCHFSPNKVDNGISTLSSANISSANDYVLDAGFCDCGTYVPSFSEKVQLVITVSLGICMMGWSLTTAYFTPALNEIMGFTDSTRRAEASLVDVAKFFALKIALTTYNAVAVMFRFTSVSMLLVALRLYMIDKETGSVDSWGVAGLYASVFCISVAARLFIRHIFTRKFHRTAMFLYRQISRIFRVRCCATKYQIKEVADTRIYSEQCQHCNHELAPNNLKSMLCNLFFPTKPRPRHHCRACGKSFCNTCSQHRLILHRPRLHHHERESEKLRVCNQCYKTLRGDAHWRRKAELDDLRDRVSRTAAALSMLSDNVFAHIDMRKDARFSVRRYRAAVFWTVVGEGGGALAYTVLRADVSSCGLTVGLPVVNLCWVCVGLGFFQLLMHVVIVERIMSDRDKKRETGSLVWSLEQNDILKRPHSFYGSGGELKEHQKHTGR